MGANANDGQEAERSRDVAEQRAAANQRATQLAAQEWERQRLHLVATAAEAEQELQVELRHDGDLVEHETPHVPCLREHVNALEPWAFEHVSSPTPRSLFFHTSFCIDVPEQDPC